MGYALGLTIDEVLAIEPEGSKFECHDAPGLPRSPLPT
jgi:hypothetical protein